MTAHLLGPYGEAYNVGTKAGKRNSSLHANPHPIGRDRHLWLAGWHRGRSDVVIKKKGKTAQLIVEQCRQAERIYLAKAETVSVA